MQPAFPLRLMVKDYRLILDTAMGLPVAMPATAAAAQVGATELARQSATGRDEDFSSVVPGNSAELFPNPSPDELTQAVQWIWCGPSNDPH